MAISWWPEGGKTGKRKEQRRRTKYRKETEVGYASLRLRSPENEMKTSVSRRGRFRSSSASTEAGRERKNGFHLILREKNLSR